MALPDKVPAGDGKVRWAAGAVDGMFGGAGLPNEVEAHAVRIAHALGLTIESPSESNMATLATALEDASAIDHVDALLDQLDGRPDPLDDRWRSFAKWMATTAPDRNSVKYAMAILGLVHDDESLEVLRVLGRHEEFTLYAAIAVTRSLDDPDPILWELGRSTEGWGRIHTIRFLDGTENPEVRRWMLVDGFRCWVMPSYTALISAETGGLLEALTGSPEADVLHGAGEILRALIDGDSSIDDYGDGPLVVALYLDRIRDSEPRLEQRLAIASIEAGPARRSDASAEFPGTTSKWRVEQRVKCRRLADRPVWRQLVQRGLSSDDDDSFGVAVEVAEEIGVDPWPACFERLTAGRDGRTWLWQQVTVTDDLKRMVQVVELAETRLPLDAIASGDASAVVAADHRAFEAVLAGMRPFPGLGHDLILAGLRSSSERGRKFAVWAVAPWGEERWTPKLRAALSAARVAEGNRSLASRLDRVLEGPPVDLDEWIAQAWSSD